MKHYRQTKPITLTFKETEVIYSCIQSAKNDLLEDLYEYKEPGDELNRANIPEFERLTLDLFDSILKKIDDGGEWV